MGNAYAKRTTSTATTDSSTATTRGARAHGEHATVLVTGATGNIGHALVQTLLAQFPHLEIRAGVRDPVRAAELYSKLERVRCVPVDTERPETLLAAMAGVNRVFISTPNVQNRVQATMELAKAAKAAGASHVVYMSMPSVAASYTVFGAQFNEIENQMRSLGITTTAIRAHLFMEDLQLSTHSIHSDSSILCPFSPDMQFAHVSIHDVAVAAATVLNTPRTFGAAYYTISGPEAVTMKQVTDYVASYLNKDIVLKTITYDEAKEQLLSLGLQDWYVQGLLEMFRLVDEGRVFHDVSYDFQRIVGRRGTTTLQWLREHVTLFQ
eukprot:TRINITY_DN7516_c0_g1_i1.p1 TRINITY_DN7516_c0_g1~~TRINITY_DN7516_c0_g1_i1.p1  ORF type:complete len:323 (-),score=71.18 TRINITY_DN7516_c0_g1_i1:23-991(-)